MNSEVKRVCDDPEIFDGGRDGYRRRWVGHPAITVLVLLVLGGAAAAAAAAAADAAQDGPGCTLERCGAHPDSTALPQAVREVVRDVLREEGRIAVEKPRAPARTAPVETPLAPSDVWERRFGNPGSREDYNCALSVGVGGALGGDRFLATRNMGRTKVWHGE